MSCRDKVGCVICRSSAAFVIFSSLATIKKYLSTRISIVLISPHYSNNSTIASEKRQGGKGVLPGLFHEYTYTAF